MAHSFGRNLLTRLREVVQKFAHSWQAFALSAVSVGRRYRHLAWLGGAKFGKEGDTVRVRTWTGREENRVACGNLGLSGGWHLDPLGDGAR